MARFGGEEFALIMRETPADNALIAVERIRRRVETAKLIFDDKATAVTISIGVATWIAGKSESVEDLIRLADEYLYRAKRSGRNRTESAAMD